MTTFISMLMRTLSPRFAALKPALAPLLAGVLAVGLSACSKPDKGKLTPPEVLVSPYDSIRGTPIWALAPLANESGVSFVDTLAMSDILVAKLSEVRGLTCLPMNRTIAAMRSLGNVPINSPAAARQLANTLGVDGVVVGTITAYDPYNPPTVGLSLALFARERAPSPELDDPMRLSTAPTDQTQSLKPGWLDRPVSTVSELLDAKNHDVLMHLQRFANGRHDPDSSLGWRSYLISTDLYNTFAAHHTISRLLEQERLRLAQSIPLSTSAPTSLPSRPKASPKPVGSLTTQQQRPATSDPTLNLIPQSPLEQTPAPPANAPRPAPPR